jgi:hypothetical protein
LQFEQYDRIAGVVVHCRPVRNTFAGEELLKRLVRRIATGDHLPTQGADMNEQQARDIADRFIAQLHRLEDGDKAVADDIADMFADSAELTNPVIEHNGGSRHGREQIAAFWRQYAETFGEIHSEFFDVTMSDHSAGLFWRSSGTSHSGDAMEYDGVSLLVFDDAGKITRFQGFFDPRRLSMKPAH